MQAKIQNDFAHILQKNNFLAENALGYMAACTYRNWLGYLLFVKVLRLAYFHPIIITINTRDRGQLKILILSTNVYQK